MRAHRVAPILVFGLLAAACGGDDDDPSGPELPGPRTVQLLETNASGVTGTATITPQSASVSTVTVTLQGMPPNTQHAGHVHRGTCPDGPIDQGLNPVTADANGSGSATTEGVSNAFLQSGYFFQYHVQLDPPGPGIACGNIGTASPSSDPEGPGY